MAEAHSAVAFSFTVTHEGVDVNLDHDALKAVWNSGIHSWKKRLGRAKVGVRKYSLQRRFNKSLSVAL